MRGGGRGWGLDGRAPCSLQPAVLWAEVPWADEGGSWAGTEGLSVLSASAQVNIVLSVLDFLGYFTHMDAAIMRALRQLSQLASTKHIRVQRKAKQISANCQSDVVERVRVGRRSRWWFSTVVFTTLLCNAHGRGGWGLERP